MTDLRFGVLGPLEVTRGAEPVPVPTGRRRAVLACLLVHAGRPVPAGVLIEAAWRDDLPADPRAALNTVLSRLRTALGPEAVTAGPAGYTLDVADVEVDARRFETLRMRAKSAPAEEAGALLDEALALWHGRAFDEFADRDFAAPEAERLERLRLDAVEARAAAAIDTGDCEDAAADLEALLVEHPYREHAVQLLLTALYQSGRQADALERYRAYRASLDEELGLDPSPALRDLESRILGHEVGPAAGPGTAVSAPTWLDTSATFLGRDSALADLVAAVASDRAVTVTGIGGVGKTRLAAQALPMLADRLRMPITVVELESVRSGQVATAVADAFGLGQQAGTTTDDVLEYLSIAHAVVVLDNCEHLLDEVAALADAVMRRCPRVRLVATSRHRLGIASERVVPLAPFPVPAAVAGTERIETNPAVQLFADRVRRLRPGFGLTAENAVTVAEICRRLDGLPLALELAASRAATLGVGPVLAGLDTHLAGATFPGLRAVVAWSARLLTAEQRRLLAQLSVFAGGFDADAVASVAARLGHSESDDVAAALGELVESSLLSAHEQDGEVRYRMLVLVRSYAALDLTRSGEDERARLAHAQWMGEVAERAAHGWVAGNAAAASARLSRCGPDLTAALRWALDEGRLDVASMIACAVKLCMHWLPSLELGDLVVEVAKRCADDAGPHCARGVAAGAMTSAERGDAEHARGLADAAIARSEETPVRQLAMTARAVTALYAADSEESMAWLRRLADLPGLEPGYRVEPDITRALLECYHDDLPAARGYAATALLGAEAAGAEAAHAFALYAAGEIEVGHDPDRGAALFRDAADRAERIGAAHVSQVARIALYAVLVRSGRDAEALDLVEPLLDDVRRAGSWPQLWTTMRLTAELLMTSGRPQDAAFLLAAADASPTAPPLVSDDVDRYDRLWAELSERLGGGVVERISEFAASLPRTQVVDRAAAVLGHLACSAHDC